MHPPADTYTANVINRLDAKIANLQCGKLTSNDQDILKSRLCFIWQEPPETSSTTNVTKWRNARARRAYLKVQDADNHDFMAMVLEVTPTECSKTKFDPPMNHLINIGTTANRYFLDAKAKEFLESVAAEQGFAGNHRYVTFMKTLFPKSEIRQIQFAYSLVSRNDTEKFWRTMLEGIRSSKLWLDEEKQGGSLSGCFTILIPTSENEDASCTIRVQRNVLMQAIHDFRLTKLDLE